MKWSKTRFLLALIFLTGAALRFYQLGYQSLWYDELFSVLAAKRPLPDMLLRLVTGDVHPPLFYLFLHLSLRLGNSELAARLVSFVFATLSLPLFYLLVRQWMNEASAVVATGLLAVSPFHVLFAQEARMYAMLGFWVLGMTYFFWQAWENGRFRHWLFFTLALVLALYTHNLAFLYLLALDIFALIAGNRRRWRPLLLAHIAAFALLAPWVGIWIGQASRVTAGFWARPPTPLGLFLAVYLLIFGPSAPGWLAPTGLTAVLLLLAFLILHLARLGRRIPPGLWLAVTLFLAPLFSLYGLAFIRPVFVERIFLPASFGLYALLGWGIIHAPPRWLNRFAGGVIFLAMLGALANYYHNPDVQKPPLREITTRVAAQVEPGDVVVHTSDSSALAFDWYAPELSPEVSYYLAGDPDFEQETARAYGGRAAGLRPLPAARILPLARRVWLVVALDHNIAYQRSQVEWFDRQFTRREHQMVGNVDILRYDVEP